MNYLIQILVYCFVLVLSFTSQATQAVALSIEIIDPAAVARKLNIDNVYRTIQVKGKQYYAGFIIDSDGINHSVLIEVDADEKQQYRWVFEDIISDVFILNRQVSVVLDSGQNYSLVNNVWVQNQQSFSQNARVVFSDGDRHLVVCSPSSLLKASTHAAGCESINPHWKLFFSWQEFEPRVCGGFLYAVTWEQKNNQRLVINLNSGKVIHKTMFSGEDICTPFN